MLYTTEQLKGHTVMARDEDMGNPKDFVLNPRIWKATHFVVDTGGWLIPRQTILSPDSIESIDPFGKTILLNVTKQTVDNSPPIDTGEIISTQEAAVLHKYYLWGNFGLDLDPTILMDPMGATQTAVLEIDETKEDPTRNPHLYSVNQIIDYDVIGSSGLVGKVDDFYISFNSWKIRHMLIDTSKWIPIGKKVLIDPDWVTSLDHENRNVYIDLDQEKIEGAPSVDPRELLNRQEETKNYAYFERPPYWE